MIDRYETAPTLQDMVMYSVNAHSKNLDAAWEFIKYLRNEEADMEWVRDDMGALAVTNAALSSPEAQNVKDLPLFDQGIEACTAAPAASDDRCRGEQHVHAVLSEGDRRGTLAAGCAGSGCARSPECHRRQGMKKATPYLLLLPALLFTALVVVYPLVQNVINSVREVSMVKGIGTWVGFSNYEHVLQDPLFLLSFRNTLDLCAGRHGACPAHRARSGAAAEHEDRKDHDRRFVSLYHSVGHLAGRGRVCMEMDSERPFRDRQLLAFFSGSD